jgi:hypothetical protein
MAPCWAIAVVFAIAGAPLAPAICGLTCASHHKPGTSSSSERHTCHETSQDGAMAVPVPHTCGHDSDDSIAPQELIQILVSMGLAETPVIALATLELPTVIVSSPVIQHSPPGLPALTTPLRV